MSLMIYDTYQRKLVPFESLEPGRVRMYNCGPTIHDFAHIGNFRAYIFADLLRRTLEYRGYEVRQVMNLTDVEDKTIRKSREEGVSLSSFTIRFRDAFFEDLDSLHILPAHVYPAATEHIDEMVRLVQQLLEKGYAYRAEDGSIYFRVASFPDYGNLSGKRLEDLRIGERVSSDEYESKDDVRDFALWKAWDESDGNVFWETPLGKGRPGWHIECSAMSMKHLGPEFDIHTGGVDNIFPHHENEIAQSRCAIDTGFSKHWMHCEYLLVESRKMSKSLGNFYTLRDILNMGYRPRELRYVLISTHYRTQLNFTMDSLKGARSALNRIDEFQANWQNWKDGSPSAEADESIARAETAFNAALDDDLNTSQAFAALFNLIREINSLAAAGSATAGDRERIGALWEGWDHILGVLKPWSDSSVEPDADRVEQLIAERNQARSLKNWSRADEIRRQLLDEGIELKDNPNGTTWKRV